MINFPFIIYIMGFIVAALVALFVLKRSQPTGYKKGEVRQCIYCGASIGSDREFCGKCGKKQPTYGHLPPKL